MIKRTTLCSAIFFAAALSSVANGQSTGAKPYSSQFSIRSDNDFYLLREKDGYYTNGLIFSLDVASKKHGAGLTKKINRYEVGQLLFNQGNRKIRSVSLIDRPVTGYLYAKFLQSGFKTTRKFYQWGASIGTIGKASLGENMQSFFHRQISVNSNYWGWVWDYQLKTEVGVNVHGAYAASLIKKEKTAFQVTPHVDATIGTMFTNLTPGVLFQLGKLNSASESSYWQSAISREQPVTGDVEYFVFYHPRLTYQTYNATVQGGLFREDKGPITSNPEPVVLLQQVGVMVSKARYSFSYSVAFQTREAESQIANHAFGSIQLAYRFR